MGGGDVGGGGGGGGVDLILVGGEGHHPGVQVGVVHGGGEGVSVGGLDEAGGLLGLGGLCGGVGGEVGLDVGLQVGVGSLRFVLCRVEGGWTGRTSSRRRRS